jgi:bifunctional DNase/RNase
MLPVDLLGIQMDPATGAGALVLREHGAPHRLMQIVVGGAEATSIAIAASRQSLPRPMTHDVMATLVDSLDAHIDAAEVTELRDGSFLATLALSGPTGERRLDVRPSDAIALAIRLDAPLFVSEDVLDEVGTLPPIDLDDDAIDAEVDAFRTFLDELDPADFSPASSAPSEFPPPTTRRLEHPDDVDEIDGGNPED